MTKFDEMLLEKREGAVQNRILFPYRFIGFNCIKGRFSVFYSVFLFVFSFSKKKLISRNICGEPKVEFHYKIEVT